MEDGRALQQRAEELGLTPDDVASWSGRVDDALVSAVLAALIRFEDALRELAR